MSRVILLDAGVVGLACVDPRKSAALAFRRWLVSTAGPAVFHAIAEITRYEVRRELVRLGATGGLRRLDEFGADALSIPMTYAAWEKAGDFWALVRQAGKPTASPEALDADAILAGVAATVGGLGDQIIIATTNVRHLSWFPGIDAREWEAIGPEK